MVWEEATERAQVYGLLSSTPGDPHEVPGCWLEPDPCLVFATWEVSQQKEDLTVCTSLSNSVFQIPEIFLNIYLFI